MRIPAALVVVLALLPPAANAQMILQPTPPQPGQMTMQGHGEVTAAPDSALITSGVTSQGATAREALDTNTRDMTALIAALKAAGIEPRDIQTSSFTVSPNYVYTDERDASGYTLPPRINGYTVTNQVSVRVRDLESLGRVLDQSVSVGANTIGGISFSVEDPGRLLDEARRLAFSDALAKAGLYAQAAGITLGRIVTISESTYEPPQPYLMRQVADAAAVAPVPVETGEIAFSIDVNVTWSLVQ